MKDIQTPDTKFVDDIKQIIIEGRKQAFNAINQVMTETYWNIGRKIVEQEQDGNNRANYGKQIIKLLANELTMTFGKGFSERYLYYYRKLYLLFPDIEILKTRFQNLTWSHLLTVLRVENKTALLWYVENASKEMWSVRNLSRNISTQYYERHFKQPTLEHKTKKIESTEILKNPFIAEFLGFETDTTISETDLESSIISHLKDFLLEMGRGFAFVARQQHIHTDAEDYYIDLVFYNIYLKCYVLVDLKMGKIRHQDVGQMDMYVRMYDELKRTETDNPTIGILLCSETDEAIAKYSVLHNNDQLFAAKLMTYLPTEAELKAEIEHQKQIFQIQHDEDKNA